MNLFYKESKSFVYSFVLFYLFFLAGGGGGGRGRRCAMRRGEGGGLSK